MALFSFFFTFLPMVLVTLANFSIIHSIIITRKSIESSSSSSCSPARTLKTIPLISLTFIASYLPYLIALIANLISPMPAWWRTVSFYFAAINTMANPLIYFCVNIKFRRFILAFARRILLGASLKLSDTSEPTQNNNHNGVVNK